MAQVVFVSPHLDDAVFSCGTLIATAALLQPVTVMTVCAGVPDFDHATALDGAAGFASSRDAMEARRAEDLAACGLLGAETLHLDVLDSSYADSDVGRVEVMRGAIKAGLGLLGVSRKWTDDDGQAVIVAPLGVRHVDHKNVAAACASFADLVYQELPYSVLWPEQMPEDVPPVALKLPVTELKLDAIRCYRSQLGDGPPGVELSEAELYHRLDDPRRPCRVRILGSEPRPQRPGCRHGTSGGV